MSTKDLEFQKILLAFTGKTLARPDSDGRTRSILTVQAAAIAQEIQELEANLPKVAKLKPKVVKKKTVSKPPAAKKKIVRGKRK
jgi:hypothetical protein